MKTRSLCLSSLRILLWDDYSLPWIFFVRTTWSPSVVKTRTFNAAYIKPGVTWIQFTSTDLVPYDLFVYYLHSSVSVSFPHRIWSLRWSLWIVIVACRYFNRFYFRVHCVQAVCPSDCTFWSNKSFHQSKARKKPFPWI